MGDFTEQKPEVFWEVVKLDFNRGIRNKKSGKVKKCQLWVSFRYFEYWAKNYSSAIRPPPLMH